MCVQDMCVCVVCGHAVAHVPSREHCLEKGSGYGAPAAKEMVSSTYTPKPTEVTLNPKTGCCLNNVPLNRGAIEPMSYRTNELLNQ